MKQKILVTGGAGYIGSTLVPRLLRSGFKVTVLDNFLFEQNSLAHVCGDPNFEVVRGDVRSDEAVMPLVKKADIIIPLAAYVGVPLCDQNPEDATATNKEAIVRLVKHASKDQWILIPTTNSGYGVGEKNQFCTEETPLRPISLYGRDKVAAEKAVLERKNSISFRLATAFGMSPRMRIDLLVNDFTYRAVHEGSITLFESHFRRNFVHVSDIARAFLHGIEHFDKMKGEVYNVGLSDANLSKLELCQRIKMQLPDFVISEDATGKDPDKRDYIVSNEKIEKTGFKTGCSLDNGIRELIKGYAMIKKSPNVRYSNV
jgi:nucleoside-diphosphate-sugar epimerase